MQCVWAEVSPRLWHTPHAFAPALRVGCPLTTNIEHCARWVKRSESPTRKGSGEVGQLCTRSYPNAENSPICWQVGKDGFEKKMQAVTDGRHSHPLFVVARGLLIENRFEFFTVHWSFSRCRRTLEITRFKELLSEMSVSPSDVDCVRFRIAPMASDSTCL